MILFIDDEQKKMSSYVEELMLCNYQVELIGSVNSALNYWNLHQDKINLLILDVMMSAGIFYNNSYSEDGLGTGLCFYHKIRDNNTKIPIIFFSNIPETSNSLITKIITEDAKTYFFQKEDILPFELIDIIFDILRE